MRFTPGQSGNPTGRPRGSVGGRMRALQTLDRLVAGHRNQKALRAAMQKEFQADPMRFFKTVIMPLLPREARLDVERDGIVEWRSLLEAGTGGSGERERECGEGEGSSGG